MISTSKSILLVLKVAVILNSHSFLVDWACHVLNRFFFQLIPDALTSLTVLFQQFNVIIEGVLWGVEIAGWTMDRKTQVRFPAYPYRVWAF